MMHLSCIYSNLTSLIRYLKREPVAKKVVLEKSFPPCLASWIDKSIGMCMFTPTQLKTWTLGI